MASVSKTLVNSKVEIVDFSRGLNYPKARSKTNNLGTGEMKHRAALKMRLSI
jgi:hypothetical protein